VHSIKFVLVPLLCVREATIYANFWAMSLLPYDIQWYKYRFGQATSQGLLDVFIAIALMGCCIVFQQGTLAHAPSSPTTELATIPGEPTIQEPMLQLHQPLISQPPTGSENVSTQC
jgi:hypothetical protein